MIAIGSKTRCKALAIALLLAPSLARAQQTFRGTASDSAASPQPLTRVAFVVAPSLDSAIARADGSTQDRSTPSAFGSSRAHHVYAGIVIGAVVLGGSAVALTWNAGSDCVIAVSSSGGGCGDSKYHDRVIAGLVAGGLGALIGGTIGALLPTDPDR